MTESITDISVVRLRVWNRATQLALFTPSTGMATISKFDSVRAAEELPYSGFLSNELRDTKAVYTQDDALYLQVNEERWDLNEDNVVVDWKRINSRTNVVSITVNGTTVFSDSYASAASDSVLVADPLFDATDEELEDFWLWLSRCLQLPEWRKNIAKAWPGSVL